MKDCWILSLDDHINKPFMIGYFKDYNTAIKEIQKKHRDKYSFQKIENTRYRWKLTPYQLQELQWIIFHEFSEEYMKHIVYLELYKGKISGTCKNISRGITLQQSCNESLKCKVELFDYDGKKKIQNKRLKEPNYKKIELKHYDDLYSSLKPICDSFYEYWFIKQIHSINRPYYVLKIQSKYYEQVKEFIENTTLKWEEIPKENYVYTIYIEFHHNDHLELLFIALNDQKKIERVVNYPIEKLSKTMSSINHIFNKYNVIEEHHNNGSLNVNKGQ